ncbi:hypothetical protein BDV39DRAFT_174974 [Aspergillus sergii]|uniref:Uncharacterized protein n=1 Tax=Aspergillus sergii TaxID=1034303 RepID=A0A5N6X3T0_9EURO|nr:hypothetical protein BDV39DRAFT_174974 [Aspergillus sergii]
MNKSAYQINTFLRSIQPNHILFFILTELNIIAIVKLQTHIIHLMTISLKKSRTIITNTTNTHPL